MRTILEPSRTSDEGVAKNGSVWVGFAERLLLFFVLGMHANWLKWLGLPVNWVCLVIFLSGSFHGRKKSFGGCERKCPGHLARISHHLTVEARDKLAITSLRLLAVLNVLFKYASARRAARALY